MLKLIMSIDIIIFGSLVKWFNTPPSQGGIPGFETHTSHQNEIKSLYGLFLFKMEL